MEVTMQSQFLTTPKQEQFKQFLQHAELGGADISKIQHTNLVALEQQWYDALANDQIDYSVYDHDEYLAELWKCWSEYSRAHLKNLNNPKSCYTHSVLNDMSDVDTIIDLGCGFAYTTIVLSEYFPKAKVIGTNLPDTIQTKVATHLSKSYNFTIETDFNKLPTADLVFMSEYLEHFEHPITHLVEVLKQLKPRYLLIANAFGAEAIGHFNNYEEQGHIYTAKQTSKLYHKVMRQFNYEKINTKLWNNRPQYWAKY